MTNDDGDVKDVFSRDLVGTLAVLADEVRVRQWPNQRLCLLQIRMSNPSVNQP
jgi:hypothetical protein